MKKNCATPDCQNSALKYRQLCGTCRSRELKKKHPATYFFNLLRIHARTRGIQFLLTLSDFKKFAVETEYIRGNQKTKSLSVDRIDASKGYYIDNIQVLTKFHNSKKVVYDHYADRKFKTKKTNDWSNPPPCLSTPF